jgi:hypothetical protein
MGCCSCCFTGDLKDLDNVEGEGIDAIGCCCLIRDLKDLDDVDGVGLLLLDVSGKEVLLLHRPTFKMSMDLHVNHG